MVHDSHDLPLSLDHLFALADIDSAQLFDIIIEILVLDVLLGEGERFGVFGIEEELGFEEGVGEDGGGEEGAGGCEFAPKGTQEFGEHGL